MSTSSSISKAGIIKIFGLIGLAIGVIFFILSFVGVNIPIVINTTSYEGIYSALIMLIGFPILLLIIGCIVSIFVRSSSNKQYR
ncbi:hypothetical protein V3851_03970 [Paenibacillus sp. M1]|uniref:Uncharacterized protein n=1 Tax=Paenibacillus haidiansis TaxID=1574488 RepID=A0ABU7VNL8_9BACL